MSQYIDRREAAKSYRPVAGTMSPGLKRAREPYRLKNALLGLSLAAFAVGVWAYSISAVKQDVFDDVDEEAEVMGSTGTGLGVGAISSSTSEPKTLPTQAKLGVAPSEGSLKNSLILEEVARVEAKAASKGKGLLSHLDTRLPWLLEPESKTLVWGAPPVDNVGKMGRRS